jgi:hypothetical protein
MTWNDDIDTTNIPTTMNEFIYVKNQIAWNLHESIYDNNKSNKNTWYLHEFTYDNKKNIHFT